MSDFHDDIKINKFDLDTEWENAAITYSEYGEQLAQAEYSRDTLKDAVELCEAELGRQIRADPKAFDLDKVTDKAISEITISHPNYRKLKTKYIESVRDAKVLGIAEKAFWQKQKALDRLTDLYIGGYFGKTSYQSPARDYDDSRFEEHQRNLLKNNPRLNRKEKDDS